MKTRPLYYRLEGETPVPTDRFTQEDFERRWQLVDTAFFGLVRVSTVFLGIDHRFGGDGPPVLFETMIFGGPLDQYQRRCTSMAGARLMHSIAVRKAWLSPFFMFRHLRRLWGGY